MKQFFVFALACAVIAPQFARAEVVWSGSASARHLTLNNDDGLETKVNGKDASKSTAKQFQLRASLNASQKGDQWDWGIGFRTSAGNPASEWVNVMNNTDLAFMLENAYVRGHRELLGGDGSVVIGRGKTVILYDTIAQGFLDNDNRWDGLGWSWSNGTFGFNTTQYLLGARNKGTFGASTFSHTKADDDNSAQAKSGFSALYSFQPSIKFTLGESIQGMVAVGWHVWSGVGGNSFGGAYSNAIHGGTPGTTGNVDPVIMDAPRQWQVLTDWSLPMNLRFVGEFVQNKEVKYGTRLNPVNITARNSMYALSLAYGKLKAAHDLTLSYSYVRKGLGSVVNTFTNGNMKADNTGHLINVGYMLADGLSLGAKVELYKELAKLDGAGVALVAPNEKREQSQNRYEFVAGLAF